jgi:hypothetical protein
MGEFKEFKRVYVGPSNVHTVVGLGGPWETGEEVAVTAEAAEKAGIHSDQHFDESFVGLFEKPTSKIAKDAVAAREKLLKSREKGSAASAVEKLEKVSEKAEEKAKEGKE